MATIRPKARAARFIAAALLLGACDIPTELPKWDTTYQVPAASTTLTVRDVLPGRVTLTANGLAFLVSFDQTTVSETLFDLCVPCRSFNGQFVPKPAFNVNFTTTTPLPQDLVSAALTSGALNLTVQNGFSFDPLRPSTTARGTITVTVRSGDVVVGSTTLSGVNTSLAPGATLPIAIPLVASNITGPLVATVNVDSPAGDPAQINTAQTLVVTARPNNIIASSARVLVQNKTVNGEAVTLDLTGIDDAIADRVRSGALVLSIVNPFGVAGPNLTLTFTGGDRTITKTVAVTAAATSTVEVPFDESELDAILQHNVVMKIFGAFTAPVAVNVTPTQVVSISADMKLVLGTEAGS